MLMNASGSNVTFEPTNQKTRLGEPKKSHQNSDLSTDNHLPNSIYKKNQVDDATFIRENLILAVGDQSSRTPRSPRPEEPNPVSIGNIKTNKSFQMKCALNKQELMRRKRFDQATITVPQSPGDQQGPYKLLDYSHSPQRQASPFNPSGYISKMKLNVLHQLASIRTKQQMKVASSQSLKPILNIVKNTALGKGTGTGGKGLRKHTIIAAGNKKEIQHPNPDQINKQRQVVNIQLMEGAVVNGSISPLDITNLNSTGANIQNPFVSSNHNDSLKHGDTMGTIDQGDHQQSVQVTLAVNMF